jgi:hypothetical protein
LFDAADAQPAFKLEDLRGLLDEAAQARWHSTREQVMQELQLNRHRASNDAKVLQHTLVAVLTNAPSSPGPG